MRELIIEMGISYNKVALFQNEKLHNLWVEPSGEGSLVGSIFKGRVERVIPGLEAAFVSIGLEQAGYLGLKDILVPAGGDKKDIRTLIKAGQEVLVQVIKDQRQEKGVQLTTKFTLPGRLLVLTPVEPGILISKKITDQETRAYLVNCIRQWLPLDCGVLIRTEAQNAALEDIEDELQRLLNQWKKIEPYFVLGAAPKCIYAGPGQGLRVLKQLGRNTPQRVLINSEHGVKEMAKMFEDFGYSHVALGLWEGNLDPYIEEALNTFVPLEGGGFLWVEHTKALTLIDVNSGSSVGQLDSQKHFLNVNLEAAQEVARQMRIRNLSGMILVDFIDLKSHRDRQKVVEEIQRWVQSDSMVVDVMGYTRLGLLELTRKTEQPPLREIVSAQCPLCAGAGRVASEGVLLEKLHRELQRYKHHTTIKTLTVEAGEVVYHCLKAGALGGLKGIGTQYGITVIIENKKGLTGFRIIQ